MFTSSVVSHLFHKIILTWHNAQRLLKGATCTSPKRTAAASARGRGWALVAPSMPALPILTAANLQQQPARYSVVPTASSPRHRRIEKIWERKICDPISHHGPERAQAGASVQTVSAGSVQRAPLPSSLQRSHFRPVVGNFILRLDFFRGKNK